MAEEAGKHKPEGTVGRASRFSVATEFVMIRFSVHAPAILPSVVADYLLTRFEHRLDD
jgi:hypothetical protein